MSAAERKKPWPSMSGAARYRIQVLGCVDPADARRLRGVAIGNTADEDGVPVATLEGVLPDQAALMGLLVALNGYHLPLLSVALQQPRRDPRSPPQPGNREDTTHGGETT